MPKEVRPLVRERNRLGRDRAANRVEWLDACRRVRAALAEARSKRWKEFVETLGSRPDSAETWNTLRSLNGGGSSFRQSNTVLEFNGRELHSERGKADAFCSFYAGVSRHSFSGAERKRNRAVKKALSEAARVLGPLGVESSEFGMTELAVALDQSRSKGAEGEDGLSPRFLKRLGEAGRALVLYCFNRSWTEGICPQSWRNAAIVPILKAGKSPDAIDSYRPISLTSCLGKLLERVIANRLMHLAETRGLLCDDQAGFRGLRSTEDQILAISQTISDGFQSKPAGRSVLALLDFSRAYDTVWRLDLLGCMLEAGVPYRFVCWIRGFLCNRQARVRYGSAVSSTRKLSEGLPQGSVLAPLLFLFVINDLRGRLDRRLRVSMYADDVAILAVSPRKAVAAEIVQLGVQQVMDWSREKKLTLNLGKCEVSFFSPDSTESKWQPPVLVDGTPVKFNATPVFLGVMYDRTLSFRPQAERVAGRLARGRRLLGALAGRDWGWKRGLLVRTFQSCLLSGARYGSAGWAPWLAKSSLAVLERAQNRCLRAITGQYSSTRVEALRAESGIPSLRTVFCREAAKALERSFRLPPSNPRLSLALREVAHRTQRSSWRKQAGEIIDRVGLTAHARFPFPPVTSAPWLWRNVGWSVNLVLKGGSGRSSDTPTRLADAMDTIRSLGTFENLWFTDGSAGGGVHNGGSAAVLFRGQVGDLTYVETRTSRGAPFTSSLETEVAALTLAVDALAPGNQNRSGRSLICSDCRSALSALSAGVSESDPLLGQLRRSLRRVAGEVVFQWVPGHCGLFGNELADLAARTATHRTALGNDAPVTFAAAKCMIDRNVRDEPFESERLRQVYGSPPRVRGISRREDVMLAQLRCGHSRILAHYRNRVGPGLEAACPRCSPGGGEEEETLEHFVQRCLSTEGLRYSVFGCAGPPLGVLGSDVGAVASYLRRLGFL
jgi:ribonuclease HI